MSFLLFFLCGLCGGVLGGMGMGGGTVLIPLLTLALGVPQAAAQGVNLVSFLPMSAVALAVHAKSGLLEKKGLFSLVFPALCSSALVSLFAASLPGVALRQGFGVFLTVLAVLNFHKISSERRFPSIKGNENEKNL